MDSPRTAPKPPSLPARVVRLFVRLGHFAKRVLADFRRNRGLLLASALGYNTLLSIVPLFGLTLVVLSAIVDQEVLIATIDAQAEALLPGRGQAVTEAFAAFVERRDVIGVVGVGVLLFFSALAFRMLDEAMAVVFHRQRRSAAAHPLRAYVLPLAYVGMIGLGILALTLIMVAFDTLPDEGVRILFLFEIDSDAAVPLVKALAFLGLVLLASSFYFVMPMAGVRARRALIGGLVASVLWEGVRNAMTWYFANLSLVDVVYGSLAGVIVLLLGLEVAALILLFGAQIIAELERAAAHGRPWHDPPPLDPEAPH
jgi:YihY family inner membrane protein